MADHTAILENVDWDSLDLRVAAEQRNREIHTPPISLFRWWARRSHALIGALLDASLDAAPKDGLFRVSDPLSGGGTVAIEAARRGLTAYAQDLNPWAISGLRTALDKIDPDELRRHAHALMQALAPTRARLYTSECPRHGPSELITAFWVRAKDCPCCGRPVFLYPYPMITRDSRARDESRAWFGCSGCGSVMRSATTATYRRCGGCGRRIGAPERELLADRKAHCRHSGCGRVFDAFDGKPSSYHLAMVQRRCEDDGRALVHFDRPDARDRRLAAANPDYTPAALLDAIPEGLETDVLLRSGHRSWADLFAGRQVGVMSTAAREIDLLEASEAIKRRLRLAVAGTAEMAGHLCRWDRFYPKAFEATANHRFSVAGLSCEVNLLAERGRGTLPRRLAASVRAASWANDRLARDRRPRWRSRAGRRSSFSGVLMTTGSSDRQLAANASVDLVLTDPPYFDSVQYAELSSLFLACARATGFLPDSVELDVNAEAVPNARRGTGVQEYRDRLAAILSEAVRTLKPSGRVLLTFHSSDIRAWWALASALSEADLCVRALAVANSENATDHPKRGRRSFTKDLVLECCRSDQKPAPSEPLIASSTPDEQSRELIAAGRAVASSPSAQLKDFRGRYLELRGQMGHSRIRV